MNVSGWFKRGRWVQLVACGVAFGIEGAGAATRSTGVVTDLALEGAGWFVVRDAASGQVFATRRGDFRVDQNGSLVTIEGMRVQGFSDAALTSYGDVRMDAAGLPLSADPAATIVSFAFDSAGRLRVTLSDGTQFVRGQVLLQNFREPAKLARAAYRLYVEFDTAGPLPQLGAPGTLGLGVILSGELDVDPESVRLCAWPAAKQTGVLAQGILTPTGRLTDVGIMGEGFFIVRDPNTSERFATRAGMFLLDRDGWLVTYQRRRVQGYSDPGLSVLGDVRIDGEPRPVAADPNATVAGFRIEWDGRVMVRLSDGSELVRSQVLLRQFRRPELLGPVNYGLLSGVDAAQPGEWSGFGLKFLVGLRQGALELIQVPEELLTLRRTFMDLPQGPVMSTGLLFDLAISGVGFFVVKPPTDDAWMVTRAGHFHLDPDGYLLTSGGLRVQGFSD